MAKRILKGTVVSNKMQKTVVVAVDRNKRHAVYGKLVTVTKKYKARDELGVNMGDVVKIEESKPISKEVRWQVLEVVEQASGA